MPEPKRSSLFTIKGKMSYRMYEYNLWGSRTVFQSPRPGTAAITALTQSADPKPVSTASCLEQLKRNEAAPLQPFEGTATLAAWQPDSPAVIQEITFGLLDKDVITLNHIVVRN